MSSSRKVFPKMLLHKAFSKQASLKVLNLLRDSTVFLELPQIIILVMARTTLFRLSIATHLSLTYFPMPRQCPSSFPRAYPSTTPTTSLTLISSLHHPSKSYSFSLFYLLLWKTDLSIKGSIIGNHSIVSSWPDFHVFFILHVPECPHWEKFGVTWLSDYLQPC